MLPPPRAIEHTKQDPSNEAECEILELEQEVRVEVDGGAILGVTVQFQSGSGWGFAR